MKLITLSKRAIPAQLDVCVNFSQSINVVIDNTTAPKSDMVSHDLFRWFATKSISAYNRLNGCY